MSRSDVIFCGHFMSSQPDYFSWEFLLCQISIKIYYYICIIPVWNSLPDYVVASRTINTFKARLEKFWENQDVRYNWKADISLPEVVRKVELFILILFCDWKLFCTMDWTQRSTTCVQLTTLLLLLLLLLI